MFYYFNNKVYLGQHDELDFKFLGTLVIVMMTKVVEMILTQVKPN